MSMRDFSSDVCGKQVLGLEVTMGKGVLRDAGWRGRSGTGRNGKASEEGKAEQLTKQGMVCPEGLSGHSHLHRHSSTEGGHHDQAWGFA